ncbi:hypothetical protein GCM10007897_45080 [Sphingobium jiangsuense]|nr:hypothetical protein GCM10007897_45080 [Sphingobium jiangsuense]
MTKLQREHHSTGILDGTDEAYSSEKPPSDTYSNAGVWGKIEQD